MTTTDAPRMVIEQITPSTRYYHVNTKFGCSPEGLVSLEQLKDAMRNADSDNLNQLMMTLKREDLQCSLATALETLENCRHDHNGELGIVEVTINLAHADWSVMDKKVRHLVFANLSWHGNIEVIIAK